LPVYLIVFFSSVSPPTPPRQEQASVLYENIILVEPRLIQPYEHVIKNFIQEIKLQSTEMENLAIAIKRAQDKAAIQLSEMEEEMDQRIQAAEHKVKKERQKAEEALNDLKRQYENEVDELQVTIKKLKKLEEQSKNLNHRDDVAELKKRIYELSLENQKLKKDLLEAQTNTAFLQSELDNLKSDYVDQSLSSERELEIIREYSEDRGSLERQIEILQSANRKLHDCNDSLRSALESSLSKSNRSPVHECLSLCDPMQRINCDADSLSESCFDSGLSTLRDSNEYDSEVEWRHQRGFQRRQYMQDSSGGDASDTDVPEIRDEEADNSSIAGDWKPSQPVSRSSSNASTRRCLPALSPQTDTVDSNLKYHSSEKAYKIVLAGDAAVGKSSFLMRLCKNEFRGNTSATLGVDFQMKRLVVDGEPTVLQLWDTAGQERLVMLIRLLGHRCELTCFLMRNCVSKRRLDFFLNLRKIVKCDTTHENIPIMMVGNKADLRQTVSEQGQKCVPINYGEKLAMTYNALFCETSAKDGSNIVEAVLHLAREVRKRSDNEDTRSVTNLAEPTVKKSTLMKNCCNI
uniref:RAS and EF-hand domain containing n=1 Tax=Pelusios castaneus TaxID=367368 RepID=A0A8C8SHY5_9SAUR